MVLLTIAVVAGVAAVVSGRVVGSGLDEPASSIPARGLPAGPVTGEDVFRLRFVQAFRGYRMDQVDAAMDGLATEIDRLRSLLGEAADPPPSPSPMGYEAPSAPPLESSTPSETLSAPSPTSPASSESPSGSAQPTSAPVETLSGPAESSSDPEPSAAPSPAGRE
jgi:DivIVA domain-containing protein